MNEKSKRLKKLLDGATLKTVDNNSLYATVSKGFNISVSTKSPQKENEFLFENADEATTVIHESQVIKNRSIVDTKNKLIELCSNADINPNEKFTVSFNDYS